MIYLATSHLWLVSRNNFFNVWKVKLYLLEACDDVWCLMGDISLQFKSIFINPQWRTLKTSWASARVKLHLLCNLVCESEFDISNLYPHLPWKNLVQNSISPENAGFKIHIGSKNFGSKIFCVKRLLCWGCL